jgi:hypothetical protein
MPNLLYNLASDSIVATTFIENPLLTYNVQLTNGGILNVKKNIVELSSYTHKMTMDISGNVYTRNFIEQSNAIQTYTLRDNPTSVQNDYNPVGDTATDTWLSMGWTAGSSYSLTMLQLNLQKQGSPTGNITVRIYSSSDGTAATGVPLTLLATSNTVSVGGLTTSFQQIPFYFNTPLSITSGTSYFVAINLSVISATNYIFWGDNDLILNSSYNSSTDGTTWNSEYTFALCPNLWTYSSP